MPRRSALVTTMRAEEHLRGHIRDFLEREERGPTWFAQKMQAQGRQSFTAATLVKILSHGRTIYFEEALAISAVIGMTLDELSRP